MQGGTTLMGPIVLAGANPFVVFDATNNGTATISDSVTLGTGTNTWNINHGTASFDMVVSGAITGPGSFVKTGNGVLDLTGTNTYVGTTTVSAGKLAINGSITSNVTVDVGATLQGTGTITGNVDVFGFMAPGNSVGTTNITGTYEQHTGSTLNNEITPTVSDLVIATGNITIDAGATFALIPDPGIYTAGKSYPVLQSTGGTITGIFSNFTNTNPMVMGHLVYTPTEVFFQIDKTGLVLMLIPPPGNAGKVAAALDKIVAAGNTSLDPLIMTLVPLRGPQLVKITW
jgi:autotransporter-associated beta strand protein